MTPPTAERLLLLPLTQLKLYEHNPRREPHSCYALLRHSIQARGLEQPLVVTRRPDEADYLVKAGGNTRLQIVQDLYRETGENRFGQVLCAFTPWTSEADVLVAHLLENDRRGDLTFIERAWALRQLHQFFEQESQARLSLRAFAERLRQVGYYQHPTILGKMEYALEVLWPAMPTVLRQGLGRKTIEAIRRLHLAAEQVWSDSGIDGDFTPIFQTLLQRYDGDAWDYARLRSAVEYELGIATEASPWVVSTWLDDMETAGPGAAHPAPLTLAATATALVIALQVSPLSAGSSGSQAPDHGPGSTRHRVDLVRWRRAWRVACHLALHHALEGLIQPCAVGCGFVVVDLPNPDLPHRLAPQRLELVMALWWQLVACAEMTTVPPALVGSFLSPVSRLGPLLVGSPPAASRGRTDLALELGQVSVLYRLDDVSWQGLLRLWALHRRFRQQAAVLNLDFWEAPDDP